MVHPGMLLRVSVLFVALALPLGGRAEPPWETVARDRERVAEIDRDSVIASDSGSKVAWARIVLSPERAAVEGYTYVKTLNRYDCYNRSFFTIKREYMDARHVTIREENSLDETPILAARNSVDERLWMEVCRPATVSDIQRLARDVARIAEGMGGGGGAVAKPAAPASAPESAAPPLSAPALAQAGPARKSKSTFSSGSVGSAGKANQWSFDGKYGPQNWGRIRKDWAVCSTGRRQSPIDIRDTVMVDLEPPRFHYQESVFSVRGARHALTVEFPPGMGVAARGRYFELKGVEFYRPSAARVGGQASDMEMHLHHRDSDGKMAIVAILMDVGRESHPALQAIWNNLPLEPEVTYTPTVTLNPAAFLPSSFKHFQFMGSLVIPPCTEDVLWVVMKDALSISQEQLEVFTRLYPRNGRPIQPTNGRLILESR